MAQGSTASARLLISTALLTLALLPASRTTGLAIRARELLGRDSLARVDLDRMERGYYEELLAVDRRLGADWAAGGDSEQARPIAFADTPLAEPVADSREYALVPGLETVHWGVRWSTNAFGLRDRQYAPTRPDGSVRVALIGDSIAAGWGVHDGEAFECRLESDWDERSRSSGGPAVEVLNFAVPGLAPGQRWEGFRRQGWDLGTDLVVYEATLADGGWDERRLRVLLPRGLGRDVPAYRAVLDREGLPTVLDPETARRRLRPLREALVASVYRSIVEDCRSRGVPAVWVLIPRVGRPDEPLERRRLVELARRAGFDAVIDISDAYAGLDPSTLAIGPSDYHPNALGHAILADRIGAALATQPEWQRLLAPAGSAAGARTR